MFKKYTIKYTTTNLEGEAASSTTLLPHYTPPHTTATPFCHHLTNMADGQEDDAVNRSFRCDLPIRVEENLPTRVEAHSVII